MNIMKRVLLLCTLWYLKANTSLPKLYYNISSKRGLPVRQFRKFEDLSTKLAKKRLDVAYWSRCLDLGICPKFLQFKPPKTKQYRSTKDLYQLVVRKGLNIAKQEYTETQMAYDNALQALEPEISYLEKAALINLLNDRVKKSMEKIKDIHNKKLLNLWMEARPRSPDCLINLSDKILTVEERNVLYRGLKHHILPKKIRADEIKMNIEKLVNVVVYEQVKNKLAAANSQPVANSAKSQPPKSDKDTFKETLVAHTNSIITADFRDEVKGLLRAFLSNARNTCSTHVNNAFHSAIEKLAGDDRIKICKYDKGNGVCVMNTWEYYNKLDNIVNDTSKFEYIPPSKRKNARYPIIRRQELIKECIYSYVKDHVDEELCKKLVPSGCGPGKLYGTCKVHKTNYPLRPVVSMIGTPEYQLAKYLDQLIKPNMPDKFMLYSNNDFLKSLNDFKHETGDKSVSFDVVSLFTNVPLNQTIQIIADHIYSTSAKLTPPFKKEGFIKLLEIATGGMFLHRDMLFKQKDGVSMGNPLAPTMANFFLAHLENILFQDYDSSFPIFYKRYVDDVFCIFRKNTDFQRFLVRLNSLHPSLKFTFEESNTPTLPFLDVNVTLGDGKCGTWVHRKCTDTNTLLHFEAVAPVKWKSGLVMCMLTRAQRISSSIKHFNSEVEKLKLIFCKNAYPVQFFNKIYEKFIKKTQNSLNQSTVEEEFKYNLKIPFVGKSSKYFGKKLSALMEKQLSVKINVIYTTTKLGSFFPLKSRTPLPALSRIVYKFSCLDDPNTSYIGMTVRSLEERVKEHLRAQGGKDSSSAVYDHIQTCQNCKNTKLSYKHFEILKKCRTDSDTKIQEALFIKKVNPKLNRQMHANKGASFTLKIFQ